MTDEQAVAFKQLRAHAAALRLRVTADREGFPVIRGRLGDVEWYHAEDTYLVAYTAGSAIRRGRLLSLPRVIRHQVGDSECRVLFPVADLPAVAVSLGSRKRRRVSPEQRERFLALRQEARETGLGRKVSGGAAIPIAAPPGETAARTCQPGDRSRLVSLGSDSVSQIGLIPSSLG
jgi:hypothetical protein